MTLLQQVLLAVCDLGIKQKRLGVACSWEWAILNMFGLMPMLGWLHIYVYIVYSTVYCWLFGEYIIVCIACGNCVQWVYWMACWLEATSRLSFQSPEFFLKKESVIFFCPFHPLLLNYSYVIFTGDSLMISKYSMLMTIRYY